MIDLYWVYLLQLTCSPWRFCVLPLGSRSVIKSSPTVYAINTWSIHSAPTQWILPIDFCIANVFVQVRFQREIEINVSVTGGKMHMHSRREQVSHEVNREKNEQGDISISTHEARRKNRLWAAASSYTHTYKPSHFPPYSDCHAHTYMHRHTLFSNNIDLCYPRGQDSWEVCMCSHTATHLHRIAGPLMVLHFLWSQH